MLDVLFIIKMCDKDDKKHCVNLCVSGFRKRKAIILQILLFIISARLVQRCIEFRTPQLYYKIFSVL